MKSKPDDLPFVICSYPRSGTHWLAAALQKNFVFPNLETKTHSNNLCFATEEIVYQPKEQIVIPWGRLIGSHLGYPTWNLKPYEVLYIYRDYDSVFRSHLAIRERGLRLHQNYEREAKARWHAHVLGYFDAGCLCIQYDDLMRAYDETLASIAEIFSLIRKNKNGFVPVRKKVGWYLDGKQKTN